jgi:FAD/FMN-containing dehydrogenase
VFVTFEPTTAVSGALLIMRPERSGWRCLGFHVHHWAQQFWQDLHASSAGAGYVNMMMEDDGGDRVRAAYRGNYDRLVYVKRRYDPTNLFHITHNIPPS